MKHQTLIGETGLPLPIFTSDLPPIADVSSVAGESKHKMSQSQLIPKRFALVHPTPVVMFDWNPHTIKGVNILLTLSTDGVVRCWRYNHDHHPLEHSSQSLFHTTESSIPVTPLSPTHAKSARSKPAAAVAFLSPQTLRKAASTGNLRGLRKDGKAPSPKGPGPPVLHPFSQNMEESTYWYVSFELSATSNAHFVDCCWVIDEEHRKSAQSSLPSLSGAYPSSKLRDVASRILTIDNAGLVTLWHIKGLLDTPRTNPFPIAIFSKPTLNVVVPAEPEQLTASSTPTSSSTPSPAPSNLSPHNTSSGFFATPLTTGGQTPISGPIGIPPLSDLQSTISTGTPSSCSSYSSTDGPSLISLCIAHPFPSQTDVFPETFLQHYALSSSASLRAWNLFLPTDYKRAEKGMER